MQRGQFSSRLAFIMAASGSAVGLGNIWGFPTNAAQNGGAAFLLMYLILAFLLAYPALMAELAIGRHTRSNMVTALQTISSGPVAKNVGKIAGLIGVLTASLILSFYAIVAGWMIAYMSESVTAAIGLTEVSHWLTGSGFARNVLFCALFMLATILVISAGVESGIEKWSQRLMPSLFILLAGLIAYVLPQEGAMEGLKHFLIPDFSRMMNPNLMVSALGQAFFSLSLGVGTMLIYGSYIRSDESLPVVGALVTLTDTSVAVLAGLLVIPAMFVAAHLGVTIYDDKGALIAGPNLIFQVLPALFNGMGGVGALVGFAFFLLMGIAALTSSISMLEVPVAWTTETLGVSRERATWLAGALIFAVSILIVFNFERLFGLIVSLTTEMAQPLLGIVLCVYAGWIFHRHKVLEEFRQGHPEVEHTFFWRVWPFYVKFLCPLLIALTFAQSLMATS